MSSTVLAMVAVVLATLVLGRVLHLRVLVPSWRFFDRADAPPSLWISRDGQGWELVAPPPRHPLVGWAFAPASNLALAYQAAVDRLVAEISELPAEIPDDDDQITRLPSYSTVSAVARAASTPAAKFRWKIVTDETDFFVSRELAT